MGREQILKIHVKRISMDKKVIQKHENNKKLEELKSTFVANQKRVNDLRKEIITQAKEQSFGLYLYLSNVSPLGVPFNNLRNASKEVEKWQKVKEGNPGSPCPRRYLAFSKEYNEEGVCTASRLYQKNKIDEKGISDQITDKTCLCMGLAATAVINYGVETRESKGVSICPGPNMAYFDKKLTLSDMTNHIYNGIDGVVRADRPNMFVNELGMYLKYLTEKVEEHKKDWGKRSAQYLNGFTDNMNTGIAYYNEMFASVEDAFSSVKASAINSLKEAMNSMQEMREEISLLIEQKK